MFNCTKAKAASFAVDLWGSLLWHCVFFYYLFCFWMPDIFFLPFSERISFRITFLSLLSPLIICKPAQQHQHPSTACSTDWLEQGGGGGGNGNQPCQPDKTGTLWLASDMSRGDSDRGSFYHSAQSGAAEFTLGSVYTAE